MRLLQIKSACQNSQNLWFVHVKENMPFTNTNIIYNARIKVKHSVTHSNTWPQKPCFSSVSREGGSRGLAGRQVFSRSHGDLQTGCPLEDTSLAIAVPFQLLFYCILFMYSICYLQYKSTSHSPKKSKGRFKAMRK